MLTSLSAAHYAGSFFLIASCHSTTRQRGLSPLNPPARGKIVVVSLQCVIAGQAGSSFDVEIDDAAKVSKLKDAIKAKNSSTITCDAKDLQLFLAKTGDAWLTEKDVKKGVSDTSDLELLDVAGAPLNLVGLSEEDVRFRVTKEDVKAKTTPVHVLVVVPRSTGEDAAWSAKDLCTVDPDVQLNLWKPNADALVSYDELAPVDRRHIH
ncbi:hypothetical protein PC117_g4814 [Phytophthora cactorum]|uniref:Crinkler effector protein N-terminal domain-containing protein n=1 Tax=Phytophthora cactorum TaxID=29920 RepID=A0A8T1E6K4_9STRA|nr:hypothetical protein PC117_g4814 [Phytophthora cactorum]